MDKCHMILTDVDRRRLGTLLNCPETAAIGSPSARFDLERRIEEAEAIPTELVPDSLVTMNSTVVLTEVGTGNRITCTLVYPDARELFSDSVGVLQDIGCAILGRSVGEIVKVRESTKVRRFTIESIIFQPEAVGANHL